MNKKYNIIDTNFILRYLLADNQEQYQIAKTFFQNVKSGKIRAYLEQAVIMEVIFVLSSYYKVPRDRIVNVLNNFLRYKGLVINEKEIIIKALEIYITTKLHIVDSLLAAKSIVSNLNIMTFDNELKEYINISMSRMLDNKATQLMALLQIKKRNG